MQVAVSLPRYLSSGAKDYNIEFLPLQCGNGKVCTTSGTPARPRDAAVFLTLTAAPLQLLLFRMHFYVLNSSLTT